MKYILFILILCAAQTLAARNVNEDDAAIFFSPLAERISFCCEKKKYKIKLISMDRCKIPEDKFVKSEPVIYFYNVRQVNRHTTLISANFTVRVPTGPILLNLKLFQVTKTNSKDLVFKLEKVDCHNPFTYQLFRVIHVKMDTNCVADTGFYKTADINIQDFAWILTKVMVTPGRYIYSFEAYLDKEGILACATVTVDITEIK